MREFLSDIRSRGELRVVSREVDPRFELAAVTAAAQAHSDDAILFENVKGTDLPVATNLFGSRSRLNRLIGAKKGESFCRRWHELFNRANPPAPADAVRLVAPEPPVREVRLGELPLITAHEKDAGAYFTSAIFMAEEPDSGAANMSFHRAMYVSDQELRIRLGTSHDLTRYQRKAEERGEALEVAMLIGPPPAIFLAACASLPYDADEMVAAAIANGGPVPVRPGKTIDLAVPAETEIVIEGRILPNERRPEGPFGEFMGYYVPREPQHVFEITGVTVREDAVFHNILCGSPEDIEALDCAIATRIFRHLDAVLPGIIDVSCKPRLLNTVVKIKQMYEGHAKHVLLAAFGAHVDYSKTCMVVDEDIDIHDLNDVFWAFVTRGRADTRSLVINDVPGFYRDPHKDHWGRLGIDATLPIGREDEFERKIVPGVADIRLEDYFEV